ncbi:MAG: NUDIX domain-containing protein [Parcubacteria group bacterium]
MKIATLAFVKSRDGKQVLLAKKKTGEIGQGLVNAPGGKLEDVDRKSLLRCIRRETFEEWGILLEPSKLEKVAVLECHAGGVPSMEVHVFMTDHFIGTPCESEDSEKPTWHNIDNLPFGEMHEGDHVWMKKVLEGEKLHITLLYREKGVGFETAVFRSLELMI